MKSIYQDIAGGGHGVNNDNSRFVTYLSFSLFTEGYISSSSNHRLCNINGCCISNIEQHNTRYPYKKFWIVSFAVLKWINHEEKHLSWSFQIRIHCKIHCNFQKKTFIEIKLHFYTSATSWNLACPVCPFIWTFGASSVKIHVFYPYTNRILIK